MPAARPSTPTPAAGRVPTQARAVARRARILDAAAAVLREDGAAQLRITEVARRSGVAVASLYQYFPTRQALLVALAERELGWRSDRLRSLGTTDDPRQAWTALERELRAYVESGLDPAVRELLYAMQADPDLRALDAADTAANAAWVAERMTTSAAERTVLTRRITLVIELAAALALRLPDVPPRQRRAVVDDFIVMVGALFGQRRR